MGTNQGKRAFRALAAFALVGVVGAVGALAFVPSAEEELARAYPPALKGDLGACNDPAARLVPDTQADLAKFAGRLNGTWKLRSRTQQGLSVDTTGRTSRLYFDLGAVEGTRVTGAALLVDRPAQGGAKNAEAAAGFWGVALDRTEQGRIAVSLTGESMGAYANVRAAERQRHQFFEQDDVYVSLFDDAAPAPVWDRIVVMESSLTYVSCKDGVVERYVKVSSQEPRIEGASLEQYWRKLQAERRVARLGGTAAPAIARALGR
jgi:hypothetical protein